MSRSLRGRKWGLVLVVASAVVLAVWMLPPASPPHPEAAPTPGPPRPLATQAMPPQLVARMRDLVQRPPVEPRAQPQPARAAAHTYEPPDGPAAPPPASYRYSGGGPTEKGPGGPGPQRPPVVRTGAVPELAIDLQGHSSEQVARHYGLVLAAQAYSADRLLGVFADGQLVALEQASLDRFAPRGRSAAGVQNEFVLRRRAARQSGFGFDDIGLLYLVPRQVDRAWQDWQEDVVGAAGYTFADVAAVRAGYRADMSLEARSLMLVGGASIALE